MTVDRLPSCASSLGIYLKSAPLWDIPPAPTTLPAALVRQRGENGVSRRPPARYHHTRYPAATLSSRGPGEDGSGCHAAAHGRHSDPRQFDDDSDGDLTLISEMVMGANSTTWICSHTFHNHGIPAQAAPGLTIGLHGIQTRPRTAAQTLHPQSVVWPTGQQSVHLRQSHFGAINCSDGMHMFAV